MSPFKRIVGCILLTTSLGLIGSTQAEAQATLSRAEKTKAIQTFREQVKKNTSDACERSAQIENPVDKALACKCYSDSYVDRYSDSALISIVSWMNENPDKSSIVINMLEPERKYCKIP